MQYIICISQVCVNILFFMQAMCDYSQWHFNNSNEEEGRGDTKSREAEFV